MTPLSMSHFKAFLMLYIAKIDLNISKSELEMITDKLNYESLAWAQEEMEPLNDYQCLEFIQKQSSILITSKEEHEALVEEMRELARVDKHYDAVEEMTIHAIDRIMPKKSE